MKNKKYKVSGKLKNSDFVMNNSFWLGIYPAITEENLEYISTKIHSFIKDIN